jgi:hypothetical protein
MADSSRLSTGVVKAPRVGRFATRSAIGRPHDDGGNALRCGPESDCPADRLTCRPYDA